MSLIRAKSLGKYPSRPLEVFRSVNRERNLVNAGNLDVHGGLQRTQLFQFLPFSRGETGNPIKRSSAVRVNAYIPTWWYTGPSPNGARVRVKYSARPRVWSGFQAAMALTIAGLSRSPEFMIGDASVDIVALLSFSAEPATSITRGSNAGRSPCRLMTTSKVPRGS